MANARGDARETDQTPDSTWGASTEAKEAWDRKYGKAARKAAAEDAEKDKESKNA